jgi:hypothetical protein
MSKFWVTHPDTVAKLDKDLESEGARLLAEVAAIEALSDVTACRLCGARTALTDEHAPSKKAGNKGKMIRATVDGEASATKGAVIWKSPVHSRPAACLSLGLPADRTWPSRLSRRSWRPHSPG